MLNSMPQMPLRSLATLRHELRAFARETGLPLNRLPTTSQLVDAGRSDLHQASGFIVGMSRAGTRASVLHVMRMCSYSCDPRDSACDRMQAIVRRGGHAATAQALGWETHRRGRHAWSDVEAVAREVGRFIRATQLPPRAGSRAEGKQGSSVEGRQRRGSSRGQGRLQAAAQAGESDDDDAPLPSGARMPTHRELAQAGRHDLK